MTRHYHAQELLTTPSSIFGALIADIQRARETIDMEYYIFANDRTGRLFANLLRRKSRQGIRVRLIVDGYGSRSMTRDMRLGMINDGVELNRHSILSHSRFHRKMAVIDRQVAHIGGVNIADRYVVGDSLGQWHDAQLRIADDSVGTISRLFDYDYMVSEGLNCEVPMAYRRGEVELFWSELHGGRAMPELLNHTICSAHKSLTLVTPYFMPPQSVIEQLSEAKKRGVRVMVVLPERCDVWILDDIIHGRIREAVRQGVDVRLSRGSFVHAKMALVDSRCVVLGSANLDSRSINLNREIMVLTTNRGVVTAAQRFTNQLLQHTTPPSPRDMHSVIPQFVGRMFEGLL